MVTAIAAVLTPATGSFDTVPLRILQKWAATSVHYDSVNRSMTIFGFSQTVKKTFSVKINNQGSLLLAIKRSRPDNKL